MKIFLLHWREYEAGWGDRPDGYTLYKNLEVAKTHIQEMEANKKYDCFSAPSWDSLKEMEIGDDVDFGEGKDFMWATDSEVAGYITSSNQNGVLKTVEHPPIYQMKPTGISMSLFNLLEQNSGMKP